MARFILETEGEDITVGGDDVTVIGTNAGGEEITVVGGNVTLDASFAAGGDVVALAGEAEDYTVTVSGSRVILTAAGGATVSIPVGTAGIAIEFGGDDTRVLSVNAEGELTLGEQTIDPDGETTPVPGGDDATIAEALASLEAAQTALDDFEAENDTGANLRADLTQARNDLASARAARSDAQLEADLTSANADVQAAQTDVNAVAGLAAAIEDLRDAEAEATAASDARVAAQVEEDVAVAGYNARPSDDIVSNTLDLAADGTWSGSVSDGTQALIVVNATTGEPMLATGVTERTNPGITEVLETVVATEEAEVAEFEAINAEAEAQAEVDLLDQVPSADDERQDIEDFDDAVSDYNTALNNYQATQNATTEAALVAAYDELVTNQGVSDAVSANGDDPTVAADIDANSADIETAIEVQEGNLDAALLAAEASNPLTADLEGALADQEAAQDALDDREELIQDVEDAQGLVNEVEALEDDVADAEQDIVDMGYVAPVTVEGAAEVATAGSDVFLFAEEDGTVVDFGAAGEDILFIGSNYTVVEVAEGVDITTTSQGDVGTLEVFVQQDGDDTILYFEEETFSGNTTSGGFTGSTVTLEDVDASTVTFDSTGYITVEETTVA